MPKIETSRETHNYVDSPRCPICGQPANVYRRKETLELWEGSCDRCGEVRITQSAIVEAHRQGNQHLLSAWLRNRSASEPSVTLEKESVERILKDTPEYSILDRLDQTLVQMERKTSEPGRISGFDYERDYPLVYAKSQSEAMFCMRSLAKLGYCELDGNGVSARMTAEGYRHLYELQRASRASSFAFVAMWFDPSTNEVYDQAIEPAIRESGYNPFRIDRVHHTNRIDDEIIGGIKRSRFMVADFSGQRQGVYFEAGLMLGLGRTVIWMCKKGELKEVHFDARQYNFIDYETIPEAKQRLYDRIIAIEGEGPERQVRSD